MPPKIKNPEGFRSHIQMWNEGLTRTEFKGAFERVKTFIRNIIEELRASNAAQMAALAASVKDGRDGRDGIDGTDGRNGKDGRNGRDATPADIEAIVIKVEQDLPALGTASRNGLELLPPGEKLTMSAIEGLPEALAKASEHRDFGGGSVPLSIHQSGTQKVQIANALNFTGAGAPTVTHGANGVTNVSFGASGVSPIAVTGTIDDSNTSFTAASTPTMVNINGAFYVHGKGVTISGTSITTDNPVGTGGHIFAL